jgi:hypothetical protein
MGSLSMRSFWIDRERWAIDVMTLRWRHPLEAAVGTITKKLTTEFEAALSARNTSLLVHCHAVTDPGSLSDVVELCKAALESGQDQHRGDHVARLVPPETGLPRIEVQPWLAQSADLAEEIVSVSGPPLVKKLPRQLRVARERNYRVGLALDQRGADDLAFGANFLPAPATIVAAVRRIAQREEMALDAVYVVLPNNPDLAGVSRLAKTTPVSTSSTAAEVSVLCYTQAVARSWLVVWVRGGRTEVLLTGHFPTCHATGPWRLFDWQAALALVLYGPATVLTGVDPEGFDPLVDEEAQADEDEDHQQPDDRSDQCVDGVQHAVLLRGRAEAEWWRWWRATSPATAAATGQPASGRRQKRRRP